MKPIYILIIDVEQYKQKFISCTQYASTRDTRPSYSSDVTDIQWELLYPLLSRSKYSLRRNAYDIRELLNAALYIIQRNCAWNLLPDHFPPWKTVNENFNQWRKNGKWNRIQQALDESAKDYKGKI